MKFHYSYSELKSEMNVLENTFDIVRLVDPVICRIVNISGQKGGMGLSHGKSCYSVWGKNSQCINCISARAMKLKDFCTKFEYMQQRVYQIFCRYIFLEDRELILELVTDITDSLLNGEESPEVIERKLLSLNNKMVTDPVTLAYLPHYIDEHLINAAAHSGLDSEAFHLALIDIDNLEDIRMELGSLACRGVLRAVADSIREILADAGSGCFLARFNESAFFLAAGRISHEELRSRLLKLLQEAPSLPVLFHGQPVTFHLSAGFLTCPPCKYHISRKCDSLQEDGSAECLQADALVQNVRELLERGKRQPSGLMGCIL